MDIQQLATDFVKYYNSKTDEKLPDQFIKDYYIFTSGEYISVSEMIKWLGIERNSFTKILWKQYILNTDYFVTTFEDEMEKVRVTNVNEYRKKNNQTYYLITTNCFKEYALKSTSEKGLMIRKYYIRLESIFKNFHIDYIKKANAENHKLLNNQRNSHSNISNDSGVYIWYSHEYTATMFRIGCADNVHQRINQHNSSNVNKINVCVVIHTSRFKEFESLLKLALEKYLYRGEFYQCSIGYIHNAVQNCISFMKKAKCTNCDFNVIKYPIIPLHQKTSMIASVKQTKQMGKTRINNTNAFKKQSKRLSKKRISKKQTSKKRISAKQLSKKRTKQRV